jgi:tetratricopeptide (TPR) repeat protein/regulation of enolase protein 1 (concanavalin A-like superfamily)
MSILEGRCVSIGQPISYWPFLDILRTYLNLSDADTESDFARKLRASITDLFPQRWGDILPFLARLLSIRFGDELDDRLAYFTPEQIRHQTLMRLRDVFTAISRRNPLMLILEDLHWSDDLSLDLISLLMDELTANPLLLLCVYRPEREHRSWQIGDVASRKCLERYTEITLKQLSAVQSRQLVESLLTIDNLPAPTKDMILGKSEGNPFFIEEVIRSLIERDLVYRVDNKWKARREIKDIDVPDTIQSVLLSRVDRLEAESKYVLQCASVIGRLFRYRLLDHLARHERDLEEHLSQLEARDLVYEERSVPELEYAFKHALTQEATYQGILERRRKEFHQRVADGIEDLYRERIEEFYEELAHHHRLGGNDEKAIEYLLKSGIKAAGQFANQDALSYFNQAEEILRKSRRGAACRAPTPAEPHRREWAMLYENRGAVLQWIGRWMEAVKEYEEALRWCDDPHGRAEIYRKMGWLESEEMQDKVSAIKHLELGLKELPEDDRSVQRVRLEHDIAWVKAWGGSPEDSLLRCQQAAKMAEEMGYRRELAILCAAIEKWQSLLGNYSDEYGLKATTVAEELGDLPTLARVYLAVGQTRWGARSGWINRHWTEQSIPYYLRAIEVSERIGDAQTQAMVWGHLGQAYIVLGQDDEAIESWEKALDIATETKTMHPLRIASPIMGIYGRRGQEDMVISTFSRIMRAFASLGIDEESQAWGLIRRRIIYTVYQEFRYAYRDMGKQSEFPNIAREILEDLLKNVNSRPQRAWYHSELMNLHLELGDMSSAESHAKEVVSIVDEMGRPDCMIDLCRAYLLSGEIEGANELAYTFLIRASDRIYRTWVTVKRPYERYGYGNGLQTLAEQVQQTMPDALQEAGITQLLLEPVELKETGAAEFIEQFKQDPVTAAAGWELVNPTGDCSYELGKVGAYGNTPLQITVPPGHDLWAGSNYNAPHLLRAISGDFTIETKISDGSEGKKLGGLLVWKDESNFARLHVASSRVWYEGCVYYGGIVAGKWVHPGIHPFETEEAWLRLERKRDRFTGYVSADGESWYRCGWADIPMEDPIQVGIHALCPQFAATSTRFEYVKIFRGG